MFNLGKLLQGMGPTGWIIASLCLIIWIILIHFCGKFTEKHWGDRESGALVGFFVPGLVFVGVLYLM